MRYSSAVLRRRPRNRRAHIIAVHEHRARAREPRQAWRIEGAHYTEDQFARHVKQRTRTSGARSDATHCGCHHREDDAPKNLIYFKDSSSFISTKKQSKHKIERLAFFQTSRPKRKQRATPPLGNSARIRPGTEWRLQYAPATARVCNRTITFFHTKSTERAFIVAFRWTAQTVSYVTIQYPAGY